MIRLYLLALTIAASATTLPRRDTSCTPGAITANGRQCTIECGTDHAGGDYSAMSVSNFQACIDACTADSACQTAQYLTTNSYCYLKNSLGDPSSSDTVNGIVCQVHSSPSSTTSTTSTAAVVTAAATCTPGSITINGRSGTVECDTDRAGGDLSNVNVQTFQDCENACARDTKCITAQYDTGSHYCYLKSSANEPVQKTGIWGVVFDVTVSSSTTITTAASTTTSTSSSTIAMTTTSTTPLPTSSSTTSKTTPASSTTPYAAGCTARASYTLDPNGRVNVYNGGFENGLYDYTHPRGYPVNFNEATNHDYGAEEGCSTLNVWPIAYHRPAVPTYSLEMKTYSLQNNTRYTLSFFMGGWSSYVPGTAMEVYYSIGDASASTYACGTNTYPSSCYDVPTTGKGTGQYIQMNFTYTSDKPQALDFVVYWRGYDNPTWLLDDIEIKQILS